MCEIMYCHSYDLPHWSCHLLYILKSYDKKEVLTSKYDYIEGLYSVLVSSNNE